MSDTDAHPARRSAKKAASKVVAKRGKARDLAPSTVDPSTLPSLALGDVADDGVEALVARGAAYVKEYAAVEHKPTIILRSLAVVLIALRMQHVDSEGRPDMRGRSGPYRGDASEVYRRAGIAPDSQDRLQKAVRWHIGNILRDELDVSTLESYELRQDSPLERQRDDRASRSAVVAASRAEVEASSSRAGGVTVKATADSIRLGRAVTNILKELSPDVIDNEMTDGQRAKLDEQLAEAQTLIAALRRRTRKHS